MFAASRPHERRFQLVRIKPSHYVDGEVIQWARALIPSNTLAVLYSLAVEHARKIVHLTGADSQARARVHA